MKVNRFLLKKEMELTHQQPQALVALAGNHILKLNDICNIVDPVYLRVSFVQIGGTVVYRLKAYMSQFRGSALLNWF